MISFHPHKNPIYYECVVIYDQDSKSLSFPCPLPFCLGPWPPHLVLFPTWVGLGPSRALAPPWTLSSSGCYSLSVRLSRPASWDRIRHYRIQRLDNGWLYISPRLTFPSLQALVDHYSGMAFPCLREIRLGYGVLGEQTVCPYLLNM